MLHQGEAVVNAPRGQHSAEDLVTLFGQISIEMGN